MNGRPDKPCVAQFGHPADVRGPDWCRPCWLAEHDPRYRTLWGIPGPALEVPAGGEYKLPEGARRCRHAGEELTAGESARVGLAPHRRWFPCAKGHGTKPGYVCGCHQFPAGCKGCPDHEPTPKGAGIPHPDDED